MHYGDHEGWPRTVAVLGAGTMGLGIAECFAVAGVMVRIVDATPELTRKAKEHLIERTRGHADAGLIDRDAVGRMEGVTAAEGMEEAVRDAEFVLEAVSEDLGVKEEILGVASQAAPETAVIASNTSSYPMDTLAAFVEAPTRFLGTHWFNPPEWTPGIEVIPGPETRPELVERVVDFLRSIGKRPAVVGSGPGFVANRIQNALFLEAVRCVEEGLASPKEVDEVVRSSFGFRLPFFGPFQIADMAGLDVYKSVFATLREGLGERFEAPPILHDLVEEGRTGTKSGAGFLDYSDEERDHLLLERDRRYAAMNELLERLPPVDAGSAREDT
jgi:3-hydroxybutyryl-CoA dehydrogenase